MNWLKQLFLRRRFDSELSEEIREHLEEKTAELAAGGVSRKEAEAAARREFGNVTLMQEDSREVWRWPSIESLLSDLRYALRVLRKSPVFTCVAVVTLALGIAMNTAIFTAFDALVLRPLPVKDPDSLAVLFRTTPGELHGRFPYPDYLYYRDHNRALSDISLFAFGMGLTTSDLPAIGPQTASRVAGAVGFRLPQFLQGGAQPIACFFVSGNYFSMLGATPVLGRMLLPEDDRPNALPVVLMSGNFWQRQFHSDPGVVGSIIHLNGVAFTVIGVTPVDYIGTAPDVPPLWATVSAKVVLGGLSSQDLDNRLVIAGVPTGRLRPGVSLADAQADLQVLAAQLSTAYPEQERNAGVRVVSGRNNLYGLDPEAWAMIGAAMIGVSLLLLVACANVAGLLLARAVARRKEIAVRLALGAGRRRLLRQLLTESILLALLAGALGLPVAGWMLHLLVVEIASALPSFWGTIALEVSPSVRIFAYTVFVSCGAGIAFGLAPALQASRADVNRALREEGTAFGQHLSRTRLRGILVSGQMAACIILLISSALLLRGSERATKIDPGYEWRRVAYLERYNPAKLHYSKPRLLQLNRDLIRGIANLPGVLSVAQASRAPIGGVRWVPVAPVEAANSKSSANDDEPAAGYSYVTPNYFATLGIPIVRGRLFTSGEAEGQAPVVIISEATAKRFWPAGEPLGKRLKIGAERGTMSYPGESDPFVSSSEVIGIVRDVRSMDLREPDRSYVYLPLSQTRQWTSALLVRTEGDPTPLFPAFGREVRRVDSNLPVAAAALNSMVSMDPYFVISRIGGLLASVLGGLGLLLACMGVYGMVSYSVAQRTREIGIRMALGAQSGQLLRLVVFEGFLPILAGMAVGVVASAGVSRLLAATLFGLNPMDAISFSAVSLLLGAIALVATVIPARWAMRVDPMAALRYE